MTMSLATAKDNNERRTAWVEGFAILIAVFVCASVTALNDYQKEKQFEKLNKVADDRKMVRVKKTLFFFKYEVFSFFKPKLKEKKNVL